MQNRNDYFLARQQEVAISNIRFETRFDPDPRNPGKMRATDWVIWRKVGDAYQAETEARVATMMPRDNAPLGAIEWAVIGPKYQAWKDGQAAAPEGTPLEAWNGLSAREVEHLKNDWGIYTIEQFAAANETLQTRAQLSNVRERVRRAQRWLEAQQSTAEIEKVMAEKDAQLADLQARVELLMERVPAPQSAEPQKRGPGRPRKEPVEVAAE